MVTTIFYAQSPEKLESFNYETNFFNINNIFDSI